MTDQTRNHFLLRHENLSLKFLIRIIRNIDKISRRGEKIPFLCFPLNRVTFLLYCSGFYPLLMTGVHSD